MIDSLIMKHFQLWWNAAACDHSLVYLENNSVADQKRSNCHEELTAFEQENDHNSSNLGD